MDKQVQVELSEGVAWWLYHEAKAAHSEVGWNAWSPLSELTDELQHALMPRGEDRDA